MWVGLCEKEASEATREERAFPERKDKLLPAKPNLFWPVEADQALGESGAASGLCGVGEKADSGDNGEDAESGTDGGANGGARPEAPYPNKGRPSTFSRVVYEDTACMGGGAWVPGA